MSVFLESGFRDRDPVPATKPLVLGSNRYHHFIPYADNGGSVLAIAGKDFVVFAGDTRDVTGYSINSRTEKKVFRLGSTNLLLAAQGFSADVKCMAEAMMMVVEDYKFRHNREISVEACAQKLSNQLYENRLFPKWAFCILGGVDKNGEGRLYSYDPVGSYSKEGERRAATGAASSLIVPFLDNQVEFKNQYVPSSKGMQERPLEFLSMDRIKGLVKDAFTSATERHIEVGDGLQIVTATRDGIKEEMYDLKKD